MRRRILFVHQTGLRGGAGVMLANIIAALDKSEYEPLVLCPDGDVVADLRSAGATVHITDRRIFQFAHTTGASYSALHPRFVHDAARAFRDRGYWTRLFRKLAPQVIHLNAVTLAPMIPAARAAGSRVVCVVQETLVDGAAGFRTRWLLRMLSGSDAVVFIARHERERATCSAPIVEVIPNWVDLDEFRPVLGREGARQQLGIPASAHVVLMLGGVSRIKGTLAMVQAMDHLRDLTNLILIVAGYSERHAAIPGLARRGYHAARGMLGFDYTAEVLDYVETSPSRERIRFVGTQANVIPLYEAADVVAFPATVAHQARPVVEAGALSKPVVISDFPNTREFVQDGRNGLLVPPGDPATLADALRRLLRDPQLAARLGAANRKVTETFHNRSVNAAKFAELYRRLAA